MTACSVDGCDNPRSARGWCTTHWTRWSKYGDVSYTKREQHGGRGTKLMNVWTSMKQRCYNPNDKGYFKYGGRGITVCDEWRGSFTTFQQWARSNGYEPGLQIDRINNDGPYSPENCAWRTPAEQSRNTRRNVWVTAFGETKCVTDWAADSRCVVSPQTLMGRLRKLEWPPERAITEKLHRNASPR